MTQKTENPAAEAEPAAGGSRQAPAACPRSTAASPSRATAGFWRKLFAFAGPGYLVAVGYMDPGNWATDLAGGARFGYTLLSVIMISNLMAILLQALSARLGIATGRDLAQACRDSFSHAGHHLSLGRLRNRHRRLRPCRGPRRRHRAQSALRPAPHLGRHAHGPRRAHRALPSAQGLPLRRSARRRPDPPDRRIVRRGAVARQARPRRRRRRLRARTRPSSAAPRCSTSPSASSAPR